MTRQQMAKRIKELEEAILQISSYQTNAAHYNSRIGMVCEEFFTPGKLATWPGKNPMYAEDLLKVLNSAVRTKKKQRGKLSSRKFAERAVKLERGHRNGS